MARVLVVDDTPEIRELLRLLLTGAGHQVLLAADVDTAANLAARAHPRSVKKRCNSILLRG